VCNVALSVFIHRRDREGQRNYYFALFTIFLAFWAVALVEYSITADTLVSLYFMKASYVAALIIGVSFYFFSIVYPEGGRAGIIHEVTIFSLTLTFIALLLIFPDFLTKEIVPHTWGKETLLGVPEYLMFAGLFSYLFVGGLVRLWVKFFQNTGLTKMQLLAVAASVTFAGTIGMYFNLILPSPFIQDFRYIWSGPLFTFAIAVTITYSIFRLKLFNVRVIAAELFTFGLWIFILTRIFISPDPSEQIINGVLLFFTIIIGIFLIRSVNKEVDTREQIEKLAENLESANVRLRELDRQKSEFLSMGAHQLRTPLTSIKGYASLILEGSYGQIDSKLSNVIETIFTSSSRMVDTVSDFLNVSRIEQNRMEYRKENTNFAKIVQQVVNELTLAAKEKKLSLLYESVGVKDCAVYIDISKIEHVISNLIDNAIKYTPQGSIRVGLECDSDKKVARLAVRDTGAGIPTDALPTLFDKFIRARNAKSINVTGTGLGLYVARQMVQAHGGKIWAESEGEGKGSVFFVELPLADQEER